MAQSTRTVGHYEVLERIGQGGMAVVYRARQRHPRRLVALKELRALHDDDPSHAQRFLREADLAGALSHPGIVTVYDYFEHEGTPYIAMEYVVGGSLRPYVAGLSLAQISGVLEGLLAGLMYAHRAGVVHRDLKPENVMVTLDGHVKISDFGIAKATTQLQTGAFLTATGITVGTPHYMAPEQAMAQGIGPWTDLYSLGCMAFELLTGRTPFDASEAPMAILMRHVNEPIPAVASVAPGVDERLSAWVARLLVKDPGARTQSARAAWDELEEIVLALLGPRWRRGARLPALADDAHAALPLTPPPFPATPSTADYETFGTPPARAPLDAPPPPPPHDDATLAPTTMATHRLPPAARPRRRRRRALAALAAALLAGATAGAVRLAGGGSPSRTTVAATHDFLARFSRAFGAEDLPGLTRLFSPTGGSYEYLTNAPIPLRQDYASLFAHLQVVDYRLSAVRISARGRAATVHARYSYADARGRTRAGRPWLQRGSVTFQLRTYPHAGLRLDRVVAVPDVVLAERTSAPTTTTTATATVGTRHPIVVGATTQRFPAGEHFLTIPLNASGRRRLRSDMKLRVAGRDSPGRRWTNRGVVLPFAS